jgi:hypothetical protein
MGEGLRRQRHYFFCYTLLPQAISAGVGTVHERGASYMGRLGRPDGGGARRLARHEPANESTSAWVSAYSGGGPLGG